MKLNGVEIPDIDVMDMDIREKIENEKEKIANKMNNMSNFKGTAIEKAKAICDDVSDFVSEICGEDVSQNIFKGKQNFRVALEVFEAINDEIDRQDKEFNVYVDKVISRHKNGKK